MRRTLRLLASVAIAANVVAVALTLARRPGGPGAPSATARSGLRSRSSSS